MKNIILIDLLQPVKAIVKLAKSFNIPHEFLLANRRAGYAKAYLDKNDSFALIATTHKRTPKKIEITEFFIEDLKIIPTFTTKEVENQQPTQSEEKEMTIDNILDKISTNGIESLTILEKKFLDSNSNL